MLMREGESVKAYSKRYWEMFNEIDGDFDEIAIKTFKVGLPSKHGLRKSLTGKLVTSLRQLMDQVDKYKKIKDDQQQGKWKAKVIPQERRDFSRTDTIITDREEIMQDNQGLPIPIWLVQCFESRSGKFWRTLRKNCSSNGQTKWLETLQSATKAFTAITIRNKDIPQKIVGTYGIIWTS